MYKHYFKNTKGKLFTVLADSNVIVADQKVNELLDCGALVYCGKDGSDAYINFGVGTDAQADCVTPLVVWVSNSYEDFQLMRQSVRPILVAGRRADLAVEELKSRVSVCSYVG